MSRIDDRFQQGVHDVELAVADLPTRSAPGLTRQFSVQAAVLAGVGVLLLVGLPLAVLRGDAAPPDGATQPATPTETTDTAPPTTVGTATTVPDVITPTEGEILPVVLEYWAQDGSLLAVGSEPGWLCPAMSAYGYSEIIDETVLSEELLVEIPGLVPLSSGARDSGPACHHPHLLVLLGAGDEPAAGMTVWPQVTRWEDMCDETCTFMGGIEELVLNDEPARLHQHPEDHVRYDIWWIDSSGTPMYAEASGLDRDRVLELVEATSVDPQMRQATIDETALNGLEVNSNQISEGQWEDAVSRSVSYEIDGTTITISTRHDASFDATARFATLVSFLELVDIDGTPALWIPEAGNVLMFTNQNGVLVDINGPTTVEEAIEIARTLN